MVEVSAKAGVAAVKLAAPAIERSQIFAARYDVPPWNFPGLLFVS